MSKTAIRTVPCRNCGLEVEALTIESANPARHPPFQEQLLDRSLLRMPCPTCGAEHMHYQRFLWTDLAGRLCALVVHESERTDWRRLEPEVHRALSLPLRAEGPTFVRAFGEQVAIRVVFGLEELREKVLCRVHGLDDRVVEALKEDLPHGSVLVDARRGEGLSYFDERPLEVSWRAYEEALSQVDSLSTELPGLFDPLACWVNAARSRQAPEPVEDEAADATAPPS